MGAPVSAALRLRALGGQLCSRVVSSLRSLTHAFLSPSGPCQPALTDGVMAALVVLVFFSVQS